MALFLVGGDNMLFNVKDVGDFLTNKQFIDTVIVPLVQIDLTEQGIKQSSSASDYLLNLTNFIEHQFKGRIMLMPPVTYLTGVDQSGAVMLFEQQLQAAGFKHVFFMTSDHALTTLQQTHNIVWLPSIPLESMDATVKNKILEDQLAQVIPVFSAKWSQA